MHFHSLLLLSIAVVVIEAAPFYGTVVSRAEELQSEYDYVIVGGGLSGLVVANRLTEDPKKSVLVIEAGPILNPDPDAVLIPGLAISLGQSYQWLTQTEPIADLKNRTFSISSAKVVGGGSAINGMFLQRGSRGDYNLWEKLGNRGWGWDGLEPYFKKSETFHPPTGHDDLDIAYDLATHGTEGPLQVSYPQFLFPQLKLIMEAFRKFGVTIPKDSANGNGIGALWVPSSVNPADETRSYAKRTYHEISSKRSNYHLLTERQVTKILLKNKKATGVTISAANSTSAINVTAKLEVILAAGALHTPKLMQLSGIGPKALLESYGIPLVQDLPGVGSNLQDHPTMYSALVFNSTIPSGYPDTNQLYTNATYAAEMLAQYHANRTGPYTMGLGNNAAFLPLPLIAPDRYKSLLSIALAANASTSDLAAVQAGYNKQRALLLAAFATNDVAVDEFLVGTSAGAGISLQHPLSRGSVQIRSTSPWDNPMINSRSVSDPLDRAILVESMRYARRFHASPGMAPFSPVEVSPGTDVVSDEALTEVAREALVPTFAHPSCTCPMMPREIGGVVDVKLRVYGISGLRIVDASVFPLIPACHLQATVYAVAEKAADIIKGK